MSSSLDGGPDASHGAVGDRLLLSVLLTGSICAAEAMGGLWTGSLALLSDAAHVFLDAVALATSYGALRLAALPPNARHSYGYRRAEVLAALANAVTLLIVAAGIGREAWQRWLVPLPVQSAEMLVIAVLGLGGNLAVAFALHGHTHGNLNVKSAFLHVVGDALASLGIIAAGVTMLATGWYGVDPMISIVIAVLIAYSGCGVLRKAVHILVEGAPDGMAAAELARSLAEVDGILGVHDLHVWSTGSGHPVLSAHLRVSEESLPDSPALLARLRHLLRDKYGIEHTTLQVECEDCGQGCIECLAAAGRRESAT